MIIDPEPSVLTPVLSTDLAHAAPLPEALLRPGTEGWASFPHASATFFHPPNETLGKPFKLFAEVPTYDMPCQVRLSANHVQVLYGALPFLLEGAALRPMQWELENAEHGFEYVRASLTLSPCGRVLEGRYEESINDGCTQSRMSMWFIVLGPRDDGFATFDANHLDQRHRRWLPLPTSWRRFKNASR